MTLQKTKLTKLPSKNLEIDFRIIFGYCLYVRRKSIRWSRNFAYVVGLLTTDGSLSKDGRHISLVSKDLEQLTNFAKILNLNNKISPHTSSYNPFGSYYHIQFGDVTLYIDS